MSRSRCGRGILSDRRQSGQRRIGRASVVRTADIFVFHIPHGLLVRLLNNLVDARSDVRQRIRSEHPCGSQFVRDASKSKCPRTAISMTFKAHVRAARKASQRSQGVVYRDGKMLLPQAWTPRLGLEELTPVMCAVETGQETAKVNECNGLLAASDFPLFTSLPHNR